MLTKTLYYGIIELDRDFGLPSFDKPFNITSTLKEYLDNMLGATQYSALQTDITNANVIKLWKNVINKYYEHAIVKVVVPLNYDINSAEHGQLLNKEYIKWVWKFLALLDETSTYYLAVLGAYQGAAAQLMDDITATSKNKVKFNDTPQNPNTEGVYEGDNYITHFTATEGETSSPLMSKIMRLKEIQDAYKDCMRDWVKDFERIFYQEEVDYE